jgi:hypothetical protein
MIFIWLVKEMILLISEKQYDRNWPECHQLIMQGAGRKPPDFLRQQGGKPICQALR